MTTEAERRRTYVPTRVLIDSGKILSTTFDDGDLYFTGPQIELMRNLMQYANRPDSYVSDYEPGYYVIPNDTDWDAIQAIVADLEEVLMGNPNTLWGYADRLISQHVTDNAAVGTNTMQCAQPAAGEVYRVTSITWFNNTSVSSPVVLQLILGTIEYYLTIEWAPVAGIPVNIIGDWILKAGDYVRATFFDCTAGDDLYLQVAGYVMLVP